MLRTKIIIASMAMALITGLTACEKQADIAGTWAGSPSQFAPEDQGTPAGTTANSMITTRMTFIPVEGDNSQGTVEVASDLSLTEAVPFDSTIVAPYEMSVAGTAVISGVYHFDDNDEVVMSLDPSTLNVNIDPQTVAYSENLITGAQAPQIERLKPAIAAAMKAKITPMLQAYYARYQRIEDIKVKNGLMSCEIGDRDYTLRSTAK